MDKGLCEEPLGRETYLRKYKKLRHREGCGENDPEESGMGVPGTEMGQGPLDKVGVGDQDVGTFSRVFGYIFLFLLAPGCIRC